MARTGAAQFYSYRGGRAEVAATSLRTCFRQAGLDRSWKINERRDRQLDRLLCVTPQDDAGLGEPIQRTSRCADSDSPARKG